MKIRIGAVSYLNTKPLLFGLRRVPALAEQIEIVEDYPAAIADLLCEGRIDAGLVPVAVIPRLNEWHIISDYCIGAEGPVASVALFSDEPLASCDRVLLDYQSRTSVNLARILLRDYWKTAPRLELTRGGDFESGITGKTAGVLIGDRALRKRASSPYSYDLAEAWIAMTGKPFVFAAWIANKKLPADFIGLFNEANAVGLRHIDEVIAENPVDYYDLDIYYRKNISFDLTQAKREGMQLFLEKMATLDPL